MTVDILIHTNPPVPKQALQPPKSRQLICTVAHHNHMFNSSHVLTVISAAELPLQFLQQFYDLPGSTNSLNLTLVT